jgi:hypothetical protein
MKKTATLLLMSLWLVTTSAFAVKIEDDITIRQGDKAPFYGVLVGPTHYRIYTDAFDTNAELESALNKCNERADENLSNKMFWGGGGVVMGLILGIIVSGAMK